MRPEMEKFGFRPREQGGRGTCSVFTVAAALEFAMSKQLAKPMPLSPEFLNWAANRAIQFDSDGHYFHNLFKGFKMHGICQEELMPYQPVFQVQNQPSTEAIDDAKDILSADVKINWVNVLGPFPGISDAQLMEMKEILVKGWPIGVGAAHSRLFVGYKDDTTKPGGGVFITKDSALGAYTEESYEWVKNEAFDIFWIEPGENKAKK